MMEKFMADRCALPATKMWEDHLSKVLRTEELQLLLLLRLAGLLVLVNQILTGIWLTMSFTPSAEEAFASVEYIMRDVGTAGSSATCTPPVPPRSSWWSTCTCSAVCSTGSYQKPRELVWIFGMLIYLCLMAEAFMGYLLPWGQMSYWGAQVIISLFGAIPVIGDDLTSGSVVTT